MKRYSICFLLLAALDAIMTDSELELTTVVEARENNTEMMIDNDRPIENMLIGEGYYYWQIQTGPKGPSNMELCV